MHTEIIRTRSGLPAIWERGGGLTSTGHSVIVANSDGSKPTAIYVNRRGSLFCGLHALVACKPGMMVVEANHRRGCFEIRVNRITRIEGSLATVAILESVAHFVDGGWKRPLPEWMQDAVNAAKAKALDWHCRVPYYVVLPEGIRQYE